MIGAVNSVHLEIVRLLARIFAIIIITIGQQQSKYNENENENETWAQYQLGEHVADGNVGGRRGELRHLLAQVLVELPASVCAPRSKRFQLSRANARPRFVIVVTARRTYMLTPSRSCMLEKMVLMSASFRMLDMRSGVMNSCTPPMESGEEEEVGESDYCYGC